MVTSPASRIAISRLTTPLVPKTMTTAQSSPLEVVMVRPESFQLKRRKMERPNPARTGSSLPLYREAERKPRAHTMDTGMKELLNTTTEGPAEFRRRQSHAESLSLLRKTAQSRDRDPTHPYFDPCVASPGQRYNGTPKSSLPDTYIGCQQSLHHFCSGSGSKAFLSVRI